jgi:hypothetical protein
VSSEGLSVCGAFVVGFFANNTQRGTTGWMEGWEFDQGISFRRAQRSFVVGLQESDLWARQPGAAVLVT